MKCGIEFVDDDNKMNISDAQAKSDGVQLKQEGCVNIHIVNSFASNPTGGITLGVFYPQAPDAVFIAQQAYTGAFPDVLSHEIGHLFGLLHTHEHNTRGRCRKEAIDRNRTWPTLNLCFRRLRSNRICEATGDCLDDTPADPLLLTNNSCNYVLAGLSDTWGDNYSVPPAGSQQPDIRYIMSYNQRQDCINRFSDLQIAVMIHCIERGRFSNLKNPWISRSTYDEYEPDNTPTMGINRTITLTQIQERNFHQEYSITQFTNCDVDWVSFTPNCSGTYTIRTEFQAGGTISPDTRLTLFDVNGTNLLAQNDNISATNFFSAIQYTFVAGTTYLIRVENLNPVIVADNNSYYNLSIGGANIIGADKLCSNQSFSIDIPNATNVAWTLSPSPNGFATIINPNSNPVTVSQLNGGSGTVTLKATFNALPCIIGGNATKTIRVGLNTPSIAVYTPGNSCQGGAFEAIGTSINKGTVVYNWYINGVLNSYHGYKIRDFFSTNNTRIELEVYNTTCGTSQKVKQDFTCSQARIALSPNPSNRSVRVDGIGSQTFNEIRIINKSGILVKSLKVAPNSNFVNINISDLPIDIYNVQAFDGTVWHSKTLSVN